MAEADHIMENVDPADLIGAPPQFQEPRLQQALAGLENIGYRTVDAISPRSWPENGLFHYTSGDGFMSIVDTNSLRFSDCLFLNDGSEVHYANQLLRAAVERFNQGKPSKVQQFSRIVQDRIIQTAVQGRPVIFCLSSKPDLLNQWRDYGRDVVPYCFELDAGALVQNDWSFRVDLIEMIYDEQVQNKILDDLLRDLYVVMKPLLRELTNQETYHWLVTQIISQVWGVLVQFKNPAYASEQEWRMISYAPLLDGQVVEFRTNTLGIVPFLTRRPRVGTRLPIRRVWVGPSPWGDVSLSALSIFLRMRGHQVDIVASAIPAR